MSREEFLLKMKNITNMYSMPYRAENMQSIHYACREYDKLAYEQQNEIERLNNITKIMEKYFELIIDLGYDYDGLNEEKSLKKLIDELCKYASLGRAYNITEPIYENENKKYNILHEELKETSNNEKKS